MRRKKVRTRKKRKIRRGTAIVCLTTTGRPRISEPVLVTGDHHILTSISLGGIESPL